MRFAGGGIEWMPRHDLKLAEARADIYRLVTEKGFYMSILTLLLTLAFAGFIVWIILQIPMPAVFHNLIIGVVIFVTVLWLLQAFGLATGLPRLRIG